MSTEEKVALSLQTSATLGLPQGDQGEFKLLWEAHLENSGREHLKLLEELTVPWERSLKTMSLTIKNFWADVFKLSQKKEIGVEIGGTMPPSWLASPKDASSGSHVSVGQRLSFGRGTKFGELADSGAINAGHEKFKDGSGWRHRWFMSTPLVLELEGFRKWKSSHLLAYFTKESGRELVKLAERVAFPPNRTMLHNAVVPFEHRRNHEFKGRLHMTMCLKPSVQ